MLSLLHLLDLVLFILIRRFSVLQFPSLHHRIISDNATIYLMYLNDYRVLRVSALRCMLLNTNIQIDDCSSNVYFFVVSVVPCSEHCSKRISHAALMYMKLNTCKDTEIMQNSGIDRSGWQMHAPFSGSPRSDGKVEQLLTGNIELTLPGWGTGENLRSINDVLKVCI